MPLIKKQETIKPLENNNDSKGIIIKKYILEITCYPDGKEYQKIYPIGEQRKINKDLQKPAKGVTKINIKGKEVEELE